MYYKEMDFGSTIIPDVTNFKVYSENSPKYRYLRLPLNNITGASVVLTSASQMLEWKLPTSVYNLSKSYISYSATSAAGGAANFDWQDADVINIAQNVYFGTGAGVPLCDLNYANNMSKVSLKKDTKFEDYINNDPQYSVFPSNQATIQNLRNVKVSPGDGNIYNAPETDTYDSIEAYIEPKYTLVSSAVNTALDRFRKLYLSDFKNTVLEIDKDLYFGDQQMLLRITTPPTTTKMGWVGTSETVPDTAAAAGPTVTLNNLYLYLAVERNDDIIKGVTESYKNGSLKVQTPYTIAFRNATAGGNANIQIQLNESYGRKLQQVVHTVFNGQEALNTQYDCNNYGGTKISSYQTYINSQPLQDALISCLTANTANVGKDVLQDWDLNNRFCRGTVMLNSGVYQLNWFHCDSFIDSDSKTMVPKENINDGIDMKAVGQLLWQIQATTTGNLVHYTYITFSREFQVVPAQGFVWL